MRLSIRHALVLSLIFSSTGCALSTRGPGLSPADLALVNVNIIDVERGRVLRNRTVLVSDGVIQHIDASARAGRTATTTVDGRGTYLMPGLLDMHAHLRANGLPGWLITDWMMPLLVANGVTGVREMGSACENPEQGPVCLEQLREWQAQVEAGERVGPQLLALSSFPVNPPWDYTVTPEQIAAVVSHFKESGVDHLKVYDRLSPEAFAMLMEEATRQGLSAWGHVPLRVGTAAASEAGLRSVEHARDFVYDCYPGAADFRRNTTADGPGLAELRTMVDDHDPALCQVLFRTLVRNKTWYVPTHVTRRMEAFAGDSAFRNDERARYVSPLLMQQWLADADRTRVRDSAASGRTYLDFYRKGLELTGAAHRAGVRVLLGTDGGDSFVFPGSGAHDELQELVAAGLSPADALRAATWNGAEFLDLTEHYGSIEVGKRADLLLLSANPLEDITNVRKIRAVVLGGELLDRARLDALLRQAEETAQRPLSP